MLPLHFFTMAKKKKARKLAAKKTTRTPVRKPVKKTDSSPDLNQVQLILEIAVLTGFALGLIPFLYYGVMQWVIPLTIINLVISVMKDNGTFANTVTNVIMALLGLIPIIGAIPRVVGIVMSYKSIQILRK